MPDYCFVMGNGEIITASYDRSDALSQDQVYTEVKNAFTSLGNDQVEIKSVSDDLREVYQVTIPRPAQHEKETVYVCAKGTTPGGRDNLKNEQRIQQKARFLNYAYKMQTEGHKAISLGVYKRDGVVIFCAWRLAQSNALSPDTPISKQIKIETIAKAVTDGFVQQDKGKGELACAFRKEFIYFYLQNCSWLHNGYVNNLAEHTKPISSLHEATYHTNLASRFARNRIIFGAPGTGKSYGLEKDRKEILQNETVGGYERVTFHPDYSYAQFVGTYKPVSEGTDIYYKFVPGPFMRVYAEALKNSRTEDPQPYVLIIEEINRANVAAVFGDVFQLLDRDDEGASQYEIEASEDIRKYLAEQLGGTPEQFAKIRIPNNMFIWATMNSADQGVFPMDTAFKRRWDFSYLGIDDNDSEISGKTVIVGSGETRQRIEWNKLRKAINSYLANKGINEDKQLGPYFLSRNIVVPENGSEIDSEKFCTAFKNKVIMYLFEDAARQKRQDLFKGCFNNFNRYSEICHEFDLKGVGIFNEVIQHDAEPEDLGQQPFSRQPSNGEES